MTIFDYLEKNCGAKIYTDEYGNAYMEKITDKTDDIITRLIPKEIYEKHSEIEIVITEDESVNDIQNVRSPYYQMRGVPVTREQAFEIIRRTDRFFKFCGDAVTGQEDYIGYINFDNWLLGTNQYHQGYGWVHVDGTVGTNSVTLRYPTVSEFVEEWYRLLYAFPYLDLVIAITWRNGRPYPDDEIGIVTEKKLEKEFCKNVVAGIYVHDRKLEILDRWDAIVKYREYNKRYGTPPEKFEPDYYERHKIVQADQAYLRKCIEAYGLDADQVLHEMESG